MRIYEVTYKPWENCRTGYKAVVICDAHPSDLCDRIQYLLDETYIGEIKCLSLAGENETERVVAKESV